MMTRRIAQAVALLLGLTWAAAAMQAPAPPPPKSVQDVGETYNPFLAEQDLEVGMYYFRTKSYDAAIERLKSSLVHRPNYAKPRWYLAQAYERKGELEEAVVYYREYVAILPDGKEGKEAAKKIEKLTREIEKRKARKRR